MKSWKIPTHEQINHAVSLLNDIQSYRYFFDRLDNPEWISHLKNKGYFQNPPKPIQNSENGTIQFPPWPESHYLARMAKEKPEEVLKIILDIPETENYQIIENFIEAALNMPTDLSIKLLQRIKKVFQLPYEIFLPDKLGSLIVHLSHGGYSKESLELCKEILKLVPSSINEVITKPKTRFHLYFFEGILKNYFPKVLKAVKVPAFILICDLLEEAIYLSENMRKPNDHSYTWYPAIEDLPLDYHRDDIKCILVQTVRDAAIQLINEDIKYFQEIIDLFENRSWWVLKRIILYLIRIYPNINQDLVVKYMVDKNLFDNPNIYHEYILLLRENFIILTQEKQQIIIDWIEKGPDLDEYKRRFEEWHGRSPNKEEFEHYRKNWQRDRLSWLEESLPKELAKYFEKLIEKLGKPDDPTIPSYAIATWEGPTSPKSIEELKRLSIEELVQFLKTWQPSKDFTAPSPEGLGRIITNLVAENPESFAKYANRFTGLDATYVRSLLSGFIEAIKKLKTIELESILDLCEWVVKQPRDISILKNSNFDGSDPNWGWARKTIADLFIHGFKLTEGSFDILHQKRIWFILEILSKDPDPTPEYENKYGGKNMDPATMSINTTRGFAMHAVMKYALWVKKNLEKLSKHNDDFIFNLDLIPEVKKILGEHLDIKKDPSLTIRAVYGWYFSQLVLFDRNWTIQNVNIIFPQDEEYINYWFAAWNSFVVFNSPHSKTFSILREQYLLAIERLAMSPENWDAINNPFERLAEHLMLIYGRGQIEIDDPLLKKFWNSSPISIRSHALRFIGSSLRSSKETIPDKTLIRLKKIWESRLKAAKSSPQQEEFREELEAFGWWFTSGKFNDAWTYKQLFQVLQTSGTIGDDVRVLEKIYIKAENYPEESIRILDTMIRRVKKYWKIIIWKEEAEVIIKKVLKSTDNKAKNLAENLIHYMGSIGFLEFRDLLR